MLDPIGIQGPRVRVSSSVLYLELQVCLAARTLAARDCFRKRSSPRGALSKDCAAGLDSPAA
eukprot:5022272-Pyramimonas_sp.AAC.1